MINAKLQNLYNIKNDIGTAIVNKGGTITESTPFYSYAGQIDNISTGVDLSNIVVQDSNGTKYVPVSIPTGRKINGNLIEENAEVFTYKTFINTGNDPTLIHSDNSYLYITNSSKNILVYNKDNLSFVGNSSNTFSSNSIINIAVDDERIYAVGQPIVLSNTRIKSWWKSNFVAIGQSGNFDGTLNTIHVDGSNLYVGGSAAPIGVFSKSLGLIANSASISSGKTSIVTDNNYIYVGLFSEPNSITVLHKGNLTIFNNIAGNGYTFSLAVENDLLYDSGFYNFRIINKSNLGVIASSGVTFGRKFIFDDTFFYFISPAGAIRKVYKSNLVTHSFSKPLSASSANSIAFGNNGIVIGGFPSFTSGIVGNGFSAWNFTGPIYEQKDELEYNRWIINNEASGTILYNNVNMKPINKTVTLNKEEINETNMSLVNSSATITFPSPSITLMGTKDFLVTFSGTNNISTFYKNNFTFNQTFNPQTLGYNYLTFKYASENLIAFTTSNTGATLNNGFSVFNASNVSDTRFFIWGAPAHTSQNPRDILIDDMGNITSSAFYLSGSVNTAGGGNVGFRVYTPNQTNAFSSGQDSAYSIRIDSSFLTFEEGSVFKDNEYIYGRLSSPAINSSNSVIISKANASIIGNLPSSLRFSDGEYLYGLVSGRLIKYDKNKINEVTYSNDTFSSLGVENYGYFEITDDYLFSRHQQKVSKWSKENLQFLGFLNLPFVGQSSRSPVYFDKNSEYLYFVNNSSNKIEQYKLYSGDKIKKEVYTLQSLKEE
jgi:hypothetical protein